MKDLDFTLILYYSLFATFPMDLRQMSYVHRSRMLKDKEFEDYLFKYLDFTIVCTQPLFVTLGVSHALHGVKTQQLLLFLHVFSQND